MSDEVRTHNAQRTMHNAEPGNGEPRRMDLEIGELGIRFTPLHSKDYWIIAAYWGNGQDRHVYSVRMAREGDGWRAVLENDGREVGSFSSTLSQYTAAHMALSALKAYIRCGHRRTLRTLRKAEGAAKATRPEGPEGPALADEVRAVLAKIRFMERECWMGRKMGPGAVAMMLDGFASLLETAVGDVPRPEGGDPKPAFQGPEAGVSGTGQAVAE